MMRRILVSGCCLVLLTFSPLSISNNLTSSQRDTANELVELFVRSEFYAGNPTAEVLLEQVSLIPGFALDTIDADFEENIDWALFYMSLALRHNQPVWMPFYYPSLIDAWRFVQNDAIDMTINGLDEIFLEIVDRNNRFRNAIDFLHEYQGIPDNQRLYVTTVMFSDLDPKKYIEQRRQVFFFKAKFKAYLRLMQDHPGEFEYSGFGNFLDVIPDDLAKMWEEDIKVFNASYSRIKYLLGITPEPPRPDPLDVLLLADFPGVVNRNQLAHQQHPAPVGRRPLFGGGKPLEIDRPVAGPPVVNDEIVIPPAPSSLSIQVKFDGWPEFNAQKLVKLMSRPAAGYIGLTEYGELFYVPRLEPAYVEHVTRFHQAMNEIMTDHLLPIRGFGVQGAEKDLLLPDDLEEATIGNVTRIVQAIRANKLSSKAFDYIHRVDSNFRKRYHTLEGKIMVLGCGHQFQDHDRFHPRQHTFTIDGDEKMGPDIVGEIEHVIHMMPPREHFSAIFFEGVPGFLLDYSKQEIRAMMHKLNTLLKPGGVMMISAGCFYRCDDMYYKLHPRLMADMLNEAGFGYVKFLGHQRIKPLFGPLFRGGGSFKQRVTTLWNTTEGHDPEIFYQSYDADLIYRGQRDGQPGTNLMTIKGGLPTDLY
ncbi:hypothetical protein ACWJJH_02515 [Endozoicomonadaceae bacterium StTr2]